MHYYVCGTMCALLCVWDHVCTTMCVGCIDIDRMFCLCVVCLVCVRGGCLRSIEAVEVVNNAGVCGY